MAETYRSARLLLEMLKPADQNFIYQLVNTDGWIRFIGDRNIKSSEDAAAYIEKICSNPVINYWVVKLADTAEPMGIITLIKREYLQYPDIGFAFLPTFTQKGFATEASRIIIDDYFSLKKHKFLCATTLKNNYPSIRLLEKLGFVFDKTFNIKEEELLLFSLPNPLTIV